MPEQGEPAVYHPEPQSNAGKWILLLLAIAYVGVSLYFIFDLRSKLDKVTQDQTASQKQITDLSKRMQSAEADSEALAQQVGTATAVNPVSEGTPPGGGTGKLTVGARNAQ